VASNWTPESWKNAEARHLPVYQDAEELGRVEQTLANPAGVCRRGARIKG
jgi:3-deoxy-7-phosphoheptulonate synthase